MVEVFIFWGWWVFILVGLSEFVYGVIAAGGLGVGMFVFGYFSRVVL